MTSASKNKSSSPSTAPSVLKRIPTKQQQQSPSYKQKSYKFSAPTLERRPASRKRDGGGESEEDIRRRNLWHTTTNGVECIYVHDQHHAPVAGKGKGGKGKGKGKGKGGSSSEYYYSKGKGKGGSSSEYYYSKGKGKGGSSDYYYSSKKSSGGSGSKKSGSKRRNLSSASSSSSHESYYDRSKSKQKYNRTTKNNNSIKDDGDWRQDADAIPKSRRKLRRYIPGHYYDPSPYGYFTPAGGAGKGGKGDNSGGYICRFVDRYYDEFSYRESFSYSFIESFTFTFSVSFTFSIFESFTFSVVESFTFSVVESFTFSVVESFTFSVVDSFSFILVDDGFFTEAPSTAPSTALNAMAQARGIPFIGEHPDDVDLGDRTIEIGDINMKHIGSGKPPTPPPTESTVPSQSPSTLPSTNPSTKPTPIPPPPTPSPTKDDGTVFLGIRFEGRN